MTSDELDARFSEFAGEAIVRLRPLAHATARDAQRADDLVQITMEKMYAVWKRIERTAADSMAYARTVLVRSLISERRRYAWKNEVLVEGFAADIFGDHANHAEAVANHLTLQDALGNFHSATDGGGAAASGGPVCGRGRRLMNCSTGTVKSTTSAALRALRVAAADHAMEGVEP